MSPQRKQTLIVLATIVLMIVALGVAYWIGEQQKRGSAGAAVAPIKKFRAKPGTERENARALVSSVPSAPEETTDRPIDVWGSLDGDAEDASRVDVPADVGSAASAKGALDRVETRLDALAAGADDVTRAELEAARGYLLLQIDPPDEEASSLAFARAHELAETPDGRVRVARFEGKALFVGGDYERVLEVTAPARFIGAELNGARLEVELVRAMATEELGRSDEAQGLYSDIFETAVKEGLEGSAEARGVVRMAALRSAQIYRDRGEETRALGVSRRLRAWLGEERLLFR